MKDFTQVSLSKQGNGVEHDFHQSDGGEAGNRLDRNIGEISTVNISPLDSNTGIEIELPITVLKNSKACFLVPQMRARKPNASCYLLLQPLWHCYTLGNLTIPMLRLLSSEGRKDF